MFYIKWVFYHILLVQNRMYMEIWTIKFHTRFRALGGGANNSRIFQGGASQISEKF